ncbi:hypothetical protein [Chryseobacterium terrae]|uniref:F5/8 type C domain-containing protein n=1 Tax=Chryseobacterium terrae TaxID=3163299 RepID=A0ABW8Y8K9_9FLAO
MQVHDIAGMHDGTTTSVAASNHVIATNQLGSTNNVIYKLEYPTSVGLTQVVVTGATANWGTGSFAVLEASNDDISYTAVSAPVATSSLTTKTWPVTLNTSNLYKFYRIRVSTVGSTQPTFTNYEVAGTINTATFAPSAHPKLGVTCNADFDGDLIPNHLDTDSDNDGCSDAWEAGVINYVTTNGGVYSSGVLTNPNNTTSSYTTVGSNTPADYGSNGFYDLLETLGNGVYLGTYTYSNVTNSSIANCPMACYKPAITAGTVLDTKQGITSLKRAGADHDNWPMVRKGAWTALESKTKGFVPNRLTTAEISSIPAANLVEGMMVYNQDLDCLYINTNGTATGWKCFNIQTCP